MHKKLFGDRPARPLAALEVKLHFFRHNFEDHKDVGRKGRERTEKSVNTWDMEREWSKIIREK